MVRAWSGHPDGAALLGEAADRFARLGQAAGQGLCAVNLAEARAPLLEGIESYERFHAHLSDELLRARYRNPDLILRHAGMWTAEREAVPEIREGAVADAVPAS